MTKKKSKKKRKETISAILSLAATIVLVFLFVKFVPILFTKGLSSSNVDRTKCPYKVEGNLNASFVIKYIDSPYCVWCWFEEPILEKMVETKGNSFKLEKYDIRYCTDIVNKYGFSGTPSFVFSLDNGTKEYPRVGYIGDVDFSNIICEVTGDCEK